MISVTSALELIRNIKVIVKDQLKSTVCLPQSNSFIVLPLYLKMRLDLITKQVVILKGDKSHCAAVW